MAQPRDPPISFRPGSERLARIDAYASRLGVKRHAAILSAIDRGLAAEAPDAADARRFTAELAAHMDRLRAAHEPAGTFVEASPMNEATQAAIKAAIKKGVGAGVAVPLLGTFKREPYQKGRKKPPG